MPFVKLDTRILDSTLWVERCSRDVFITALLMAEPWETTEPVPQLEVRSLKPTGFVVPAGWYGLIPAAGIGIIRRSLLSEKHGYEALEALGCADPESRSDNFEGRRLVRIDGGYVVLNFMKYRDRDYGAAERMKRLRDRKKGEPKLEPEPEPEPVRTVRRNNRNVPPNVTYSREQSTEAEADLFSQERVVTQPTSSTGKRPTAALDHLVEDGYRYFLEKTGRSPAQHKFSQRRRRLGIDGFKALLSFARESKAPNSETAAAELFRLAVDRMSESKFHNGQNDNGTKYNDWHNLFQAKEFKAPTKLLGFWLDDSRWSSKDKPKATFEPVAPPLVALKRGDVA
jgi:hypothetical protein